MNWDAVSAIGEVVGAVAVVATLIYLTIQARLTREATQETAAFALNTASFETMTSYDQWRASILENHELARIMVKARGTEKLTEEEKLLFDLLFERLFFIAAVAVAKSFEGKSFQEWDRADVDWFVQVLRDNPGAADNWQKMKEIVRAVSTVFVEAVDSALENCYE